MRRKLIILGTGGLARETAMVAEQVNARFHAWTIEGYIGDSGASVGQLGGTPILGDDAWLLAQDFEADLVIGVGRPAVRAKLAARFSSPRFRFPNLIHSSATLDFRRVELGHGNVVSAGCALTCDIELHNFNLLNLNVTVGHDAQVGSCNVVNPGANISGGVRIADRVLVGTGAQLLENVSIGADSTVGAGAVVCSDVPECMVVAGVPARPLMRP